MEPYKDKKGRFQKYVKQNEVTGEIYSGDLINLNSKKELNLLDGLVVE